MLREGLMLIEQENIFGKKVTENFLNHIDIIKVYMNALL
jgi:hypothetical protein